MALSADTVRRERERHLVAPQIVNSGVLYGGAMVAGGARSHGTSTTRGRAKAWAGLAGEIPLGFQNRSSQTGDTSASPIPECSLDTGGKILQDIAVTGLAGTVADQFQLVYMTDDGTFTLTRPASPNDMPLGMVVRFRSSTNADVLMLSMSELLVLALAGGGVTTWCVGSIAPVLTASGDMLTGIVAPDHGRIISTHAICVRAPTDADVSIAVNLEIGGTNVTGGVVTLAAGDAVAQKKSGTAVTDNGGNVFHRGDAIDVEGVVTTAGTATDVGTYNLYVVYQREPGL